MTEIAMETGGKEMLCQLDSQQSLVEQILLPLKRAVISVYNWKEYMLVKQNYHILGLNRYFTGNCAVLNFQI